MEIIILIMLYYLTQNADFEKTVKPLMGSLKDSENMLKFMNDLSKFSELFSALKAQNEGTKSEAKPDRKENPVSSPTQEKSSPPPNSSSPKTPASPTDGFANDFIRECLEKYFEKR